MSWPAPHSFDQAMLELRAVIRQQASPQLVAQISAIHDEHWCTAHSEGQLCCLDLLLAPPEGP